MHCAQEFYLKDIEIEKKCSFFGILSKYRLLGFFLNDFLSWDDHIDQIK